MRRVRVRRSPHSGQTVAFQATLVRHRGQSSRLLPRAAGLIFCNSSIRAPSYNRRVQIHFKWLAPGALALCLAACHNSMEDKDAVRRGIMDRLSAAGLSTDSMDVDVSNVQFHGGKADADVE